MTAISTAYEVYATKKNAVNQEKALRKAQTIQEKQIFDQKSLQANERIHQAQAERARLRAASAETGLTGVSIDDTLNNTDFHAGVDVANIAQGNANATNASRSDLQSRLNSIKQPDYIAAGLQIASSAADAYADAHKQEQANH